MSGIHSDQTVSDGNHIITALSYANAAARLAATLASTDIGRVARQVDTGAFYICTNNSPLTWVRIDTGTTVDQLFMHTWGAGAAAAATTQKYFSRLNNTLASSPLSGEYPVPVAGTYTFTVTWRAGVPLTTNSVALTIWRSNASAAVATAITGTMAANTFSGQFSGSLTCAQGDGISIGSVQSSTEAQASWLPSLILTARLS
jgi:hypothetical protein